MKKCRYCPHFKYISLWAGNCQLHPWKKPKWSENAEPNGCGDYADRYETIKVKEG